VLGADTFAPNQCPDRRWIAYRALNALTQQGQFAGADLARALDLYGLGELVPPRPRADGAPA